MFFDFSKKIQKALSEFKNYSKVSESNIDSTLKEIRRVLVSADVNFKVAKEIVEEIKNEIVGQKILSSISPKEKFIQLLSNKLTSLMGGKSSEIIFIGNPSVILLCGLQGVGKTTFAIKLAHYLKKNGRNPLVAACDIYRPAAIEQLKILGEKNNIDVYHENSNDVFKIAKNALAEAKLKNKTVLIIDTAGRLSIDEKMMQEIVQLKNDLSPSEIIYTVDASVGQSAVETAEQFKEKVDFSGIVLTKLDGDSKGGAAFSIHYITGKPIKFISTGEKIDDIEKFHPDRMTNRILGMGDVASLVEKIESAFSKEEEKKLNKKIQNNSLNFDDFMKQLSVIKKLGSMKNILSMVPGLSSKLEGQNFDESILNKYKYAIQSMTPFERRNPKVINNSRILRISKGSALSVEEVKDLLDKFEKMQVTMKRMQKSNSWFL